MDAARTELFALQGKVSLVTGGSRGIGLGAALALARHGATVVIVSRNDEQLREAEDRIGRETGGKVLTIRADVTVLAECEKIYARSMEVFGRVDVLVNNAGTNIRTPFLEIRPDEFDYIVALNLRAPHFLSQMVAKGMIQQGIKGRIINVSSLAAHMGLKNASAYAASKGGVFSLTKAMAVELAPYGITVNSISPGYFRTGMTEHRFRDPQQLEWMTNRIPLGRTGVPEDIGGTVVFLASAASAYLTGVNIYVDGGWTAA